ncbi:MAG TPA: Hsp20 family protein [Nitrososphaeraceae archaeon]|jgi:HSP20 family molecular chaperone IbpA|nr:Hsp20 family protein [Nitrososphaeraceae archaeon]
MDTNDEIAAEKIIRILRANGYFVSKSDVLWILNSMTEELERQVDKSNSILERKVLCEVITTTKEIKVITELPDVSEEDININVYDNDLFINADGQKRSYYEVVHLPNGVSDRGLKSTFLNGILEITLHNK